MSPESGATESSSPRGPGEHAIDRSVARPGDRWAPEGAFREPGGLWGEILGALGSSFGGSGDHVGGLGIDFF